MNLSEKHILSLSALLFFICSLSSCTFLSGAHRFYSGPPLSKNEIALVYAVADCKIREIRNETEKEVRYLDFLKDAPSEMLDLLPGQYVIGIAFSHSSSALGTRTHTLGDKVSLKLNVQPGNIYIVYPEIDASKQTWRPIIVNLNDYDTKDRERIVKRANAYLQSERPVITFHPLSETPHYQLVTEKAKRDIKGFWW